MTTCTRTTTKVGDAHVAVHKVEGDVEMEDVDVASRIWEGVAIVTCMGTARISEEIAVRRDRAIKTMPRLRI